MAQRGQMPLACRMTAAMPSRGAADLIELSWSTFTLDRLDATCARPGRTDCGSVPECLVILRVELTDLPPLFGGRLEATPASGAVHRW